MHAVGMISFTVLEFHLFKSWAEKIMNYLSLVPGNNLQVISSN